ncbi:thiol reductant ABC exporter subunit CydD [Mycolicibacterium mengxianglii]|uniref:thiol reductant ABC exporter subunit CydD n=1 Tax=Mycolicibacterium mengxianglii TaxID=2736649 RepID=UPI0018EF07F0
MWQASPAVRRFLLATVCCGVVTTGCALASAVLLAHIVAGIITDPAGRTLAGWAPQLVLLAGLWTLRTAAQWLQNRLSQRGASGAIADLSARVLGAVTATDPRTLAERRDVTATVVLRGLDGLRPYFTAYLPALILAALLTPAAVLVMACFDLQATVIVLVALPLIPLFMVLIGLATAERSAAALAAMSTLQARTLDLIAGIPTLRALGRARGPAGRIAELSAAHRRSAMATLRIAFLSSLVLELLATLGVALVAVSVGLRLVYGDLSLATALTALLLAPDVFWPLRRVGVEFHAAQDGKAAADRAFALIDDAPVTQSGSTRIDAAGKTIRIDGLSVATRAGLAPDHIDAVLEPGRITVLTGPNGAGKSTTLQVIAGLTPATAGTVSIAGVDVTELEPESWWPQLSWLPQRPVLIPGTVAENLALFGELTDVEHACAASGFDQVLAQLPDGVNTILGRGGVGLSLGQRQRLGLARALGSAAPVLLLDEPTAHLDAATESAVLDALVARARTGSTVVVVGHRAPVLAIADAIIEVDCRVAV